MLFTRLDVDGDGMLTLDELMNADKKVPPRSLSLTCTDRAVLDTIRYPSSAEEKSNRRVLSHLLSVFLLRTTLSVDYVSSVSINELPYVDFYFI